MPTLTSAVLPTAGNLRRSLLHSFLTCCFLTCCVFLIGEVDVRADEPPPVSLRYQFRAGEVVRYTVSVRDEYVFQAGEEQVKPFSQQTSTKSYRVISVNDDGSAVLEVTLVEDVQIEVEENDVRSTYDSREPTEQIPKAFLPLANIVGKPTLQLTLSPTGDVSNVKPLLNAAQEPEEANRTALEVLPRLPADPIAVGGSWKEDFTISINLPKSQLKKIVKLQRRYYLKSVEDGQATIEMRTMVLSPIRDPDEELELVRRTPNVTFVIDLERGFLISRLLTLENNVIGFGGNPAAMMSIKQRHTDRLLPEQTAGSSAPRK